ncbi:u3 small nucleolar rna-associated protein 10 [Cystoisospora suis]|uniref:HEAT repeat-containing protein 1 n=1 Tax=Cystoisospora suis TaxID=483139 RepID=A0A2C6KM69_9APIC|nr:u3 small nucleolar rna-associated protein 10 [Cystoisospora suis]
MVSVLQRQLALHRASKGNVSSNPSSRGVASVPSFIFDPREAASIDLSTLRDLALASLEALSLRQPLLSVVEPLFSDTSADSSSNVRSREFSSLSRAQVQDRRITLCCDLLGPFFLLPDTHYILEYLLRQYNIHQHNQDALLAVALPYLDSPFATRLIRLLRVERGSPWAFLQKVKTSDGPATTEFFTRSVLQAPFFVQFLLDAVVRATSPISPQRLQEAGLLLPEGLKRIKPRLREAVRASDGGAERADSAESSSVFAVQNSALLTFFVVVVSDAIGTAGPGPARALTTSLFPLLLTSIRPTIAVRSPELHAVGLTLLGRLAGARALGPPMLLAVMNELTRSLVKVDGSTRIPFEKVHQVLRLLFHLVSTQSTDMLRLPRHATRRLMTWPDFEPVFAELVFGQRLDSAPFLTALYSSFFSFFLSTTSSSLSPGLSSFTRLQRRLLSTAEAVCALLSRRETFSTSPNTMLEKPGVSPALLAIALTTFDFFSAALRDVTEANNEQGDAGQGAQQGNKGQIVSAFPGSTSETPPSRRLRLLSQGQPVLLEALKRVVVAIHSASPLTLAAALSFAAKAAAADELSESFILFVSETLDSVSTVLSVVRGSGGINGRPRSGILTLCSTLTSESPAVRLAGVRGVIKCLQRGSQQGSVDGVKEQSHDSRRTNQDLGGHDNGYKLLAMMVLEHVADGDAAVSAEALSHAGVLSVALPRLVCLSRLLSVLASSLQSALPPPRSFRTLKFGVASMGKAKWEAGPADLLLLAIGESPALARLLPPLLHAIAVAIRIERLSMDQGETRQTKGACTGLRGEGERAGVQEKQVSGRSDGAEYAGEQDEQRETETHQQLQSMVRNLIPLSMAVLWATAADAPLSCTWRSFLEDGSSEKQRREDDAEKSATATRGGTGDNLVDKLRVASQDLWRETLCVFAGPEEDTWHMHKSAHAPPDASREELARSPQLRELLQHTLSSSAPCLVSRDRVGPRPVATDRPIYRSARTKRSVPQAKGTSYSLELPGGLWTVASLVEISSRCFLPGCALDLSEPRVTSCFDSILSMCISLRVGLVEVRESSAAETRPRTGRFEAEQILESDGTETENQMDSRSTVAFVDATKETIVRCADCLGSALFSEHTLLFYREAAAGRSDRIRAHSERSNRETPESEIVLLGEAQTLGDSERCSGRSNAAKTLVLLCLTDVALFASPIRRLVSRFRRRRLFLAAVLTRVLSGLVVRAESREGVSQFSSGTDESVQRNYFGLQDVQRPNSETNERPDGEGLTASEWARSPPESRVTGLLTGPLAADVCGWLGLSEDVDLLTAEYAEQICVNGLDLVRTLFSQETQSLLGSNGCGKAELCLGNTATAPECKDAAEICLANGAVKAKAAVLLLLPQWLVIGQAYSDNVVKAVEQLVGSARKLFNRGALQKVKQRTKEKLRTEEERSQNYEEQKRSSTSLGGELASGWSVLADAGLVGGSEESRQFVEENQHQNYTKAESALSFFHKVVARAPSSCAEFLSLLHQARARHVPRTGTFSSVDASGPRHSAALVALAVQTGSAEIPAFLTFLFAYLLPRNEQQFAFEKILLRCPVERVLPPLLPLAERELTSLKEGTSRRCDEGMFPGPACANLAVLSFPSFPLLPLVWRVLRMHGASSVCGLLPDASKRFLVFRIALPFFEWLSSSTAVCRSLRVFYQQRESDDESIVRLKYKRVDSQEAVGPVCLENFSYPERTCLSVGGFALVAETAETLLGMLRHRWFLSSLPETARVRLVRAGIRASCAAPELAMQLRNQWMGRSARAGTLGGVSPQLGRRTPCALAGGSAPQALSVKSLVGLVDELGQELDLMAGVAGEGGSRVSYDAETQERGSDNEGIIHERPLAGQGRIGALQTWDALTADFVAAEVQYRMATLEEDAELTVGETEDLTKRRRSHERFLELAEGSLEKARQLLRYTSRMPVSDEAMVQTIAAGAPSSVRIAGDTLEIGHTPRAAELASQTLQSLLTICSTSVSAFVVLRGTFGDRVPTLRGADNRGGTEVTERSFSQRSLRILMLMSDICRSLVSWTEAGVPLASPSVLSSVLHSCEECVNVFSSVSDLLSGASESGRNRSLALRSLISSLGFLFAAVGKADPSAVSALVTVEALRSCLPGLFGALSNVEDRCTQRSHPEEGKCRAYNAAETGRTRPAHHSFCPTLFDGSRLGFPEASGSRDLQLKLAFVRTALQPLCETAFECIGIKSHTTDARERTGESKQGKGGAALVKVAKALVTALGREGLAGAAATLLLNWERRFRASRRHAGVNYEDEGVSGTEERDIGSENSDAENEETERNGQVEDEEDQLILSKRKKKERVEQATKGWGTRRALLARLRELLQVYSIGDGGAAGHLQYTRRLQGSGEVSSVALLFQAAARESLLVLLRSNSSGAPAGPGERDSKDKEGGEIDAVHGSEAGVEDRHGLPTWRDFFKDAIPQELLRDQASLREGVFGTLSSEDHERLDLTSPVVGSGFEDLAEVYCRAASTALLLVYHQLKEDGLPDLQDVQCCEDSEHDDGEYAAIVQITRSLLGIKVLAGIRLYTSLEEYRHARAARELKKVAQEEKVLTERAEFLLDSLIRALSPLIGCVRVGLGCLGVSHTFFVSRQLPAKLKHSCMCPRPHPDGEGDRPTFVDSKGREELSEEHELTEKLYMAVMLPRRDEADTRIPVYDSGNSEKGPAELVSSAPTAPRHLLLFPSFEDAETAATEVVEQIDFSGFSISTHAADSLYAELLFRKLADRIKAVLGSGPKYKREGKQGKKEQREREDQEGAWREERSWKALRCTSVWTPAALTAPVTVLLAFLSGHFLRRSPCSSVGGSLSAWDFVISIACLSAAHLFPAFRETCVGAVLFALRGASRELSRGRQNSGCLSHKEVENGAQHSTRGSRGRGVAPLGRRRRAVRTGLPKDQARLLQASEAARCLQALALSVRRGVSDTAGLHNLDDARRLFLADFNSLVKRLVGLLRDITMSSTHGVRGASQERQGGLPASVLRSTLDVIQRVQQPHTQLVGTRVLGALVALCQCVGPSLFFEFAPELVESVVVNPFVSYLSHCPGPSSRQTVSEQSSLRLLGPVGDWRVKKKGCLSRSSRGTPSRSMNLSYRTWSADLTEELPLIRVTARQVLKEAVVGTRTREGDHSFKRLSSSKTPETSNSNERELERCSASCEGSATAAVFLEALVAEVAAALRVSTAAKLLLPMIEDISNKTYRVNDSSAVAQTSPGVEKTAAVEKNEELLSRWLDDFRLSRLVHLLGLVVSAQPAQGKADVERVVVAKLFSHLAELFLSRAEAAGAIGEKSVGEGGQGQDAVVQYAETLPLMVYGGVIHDVHRQCLWSRQEPRSSPDSDIPGSSAGERAADSPAEEELVGETCQPGVSDSLRWISSVERKKRRATQSSTAVASCILTPSHDGSVFPGGTAGRLDDLARFLGTTQASSSSPRTSPVPGGLYRVEEALLGAFCSWSVKISTDRLRKYLLGLVRSFRGTRRALLQPLPGGSRFTEAGGDMQGVKDEGECGSLNLGKRKRLAWPSEAGLSRIVSPSSSLSWYSVREVCAARLFVLFYSGVACNLKGVECVGAVLEDLLEDFTSVLEACREQAWALTGRCGSAQLGIKGRAHKKMKGGGPCANRTGILEGGATWFWFELGMPTLVALGASLRKWNKHCSGRVPSTSFDRLLTCSLHALDVLAVLPRISLATFGSGAEEALAGSGKTSMTERQGERMKGCAQALRLSKLWFNGFGNLVTDLFEGAFGDKERVEKLNLALLERLRECGNGNIRFAGARLYLHLWKKLGLAMVDTVGDSLQTLVELLEDQDEEIEVATREWIQCIEKLAGESLDDKLKA